MRFFAKSPESPWRAVRYTGSGADGPLREGLLDEQRGYCAYSERHVDRWDDTVAIEHFDRRLKGTDADGYGNYYAVLQAHNLRKHQRDRRFEGASFFQSRFFQSPGGFEARVRYVPEDFVYEPVDPDDAEAADFIAYLALSVEQQRRRRQRQVERLRDLLVDPDDPSHARMRAHLAAYPCDTDYPTAIEAAFGFDPVPQAMPDR